MWINTGPFRRNPLLTKALRIPPILSLSLTSCLPMTYCIFAMYFISFLILPVFICLRFSSFLYLISVYLCSPVVLICLFFFSYIICVLPVFICGFNPPKIETSSLSAEGFYFFMLQEFQQTQELRSSNLSTILDAVFTPLSTTFLKLFHKNYKDIM